MFKKIVSHSSKLFFPACILLASCAADHSVPVVDLTQTPALTAAPASSSKVMLLLPLQGNFGHAGQMVQVGFNAAQKEGNPPSLDSRTFDTESYSTANAAYQAALDERPNLVVGPLTKPAVNALSLQVSLPVATLALNQSDPNAVAPLNLFQFSLNPQLDAKEVAQKMLSNNLQKAIVITSADSWGQGIAASFGKVFLDNNGQILGSLQYNNIDNFAEFTQALAKKDAAQLSGTAIFFVATAQKAPTLLPLIKTAFPTTPIYTLPIIFDAMDSTQWISLEGLHLALTPWQLNDQTPERQAFKAAYPTATGEDLNLYGFGIDAYAIAKYYVKNGGFEGLAISGNSGYLTIDTNGVIQRKLTWVTIVNSKPVVDDRQ